MHRQIYEQAQHHLYIVLTRGKRKVTDVVSDRVSEDENPPKRQKKLSGSQSGPSADVREWAVNNGIAPSQADYVASVFTLEQLLSSSERDLQSHTKLSDKTIRLVFAAQRSASNPKAELSITVDEHQTTPKLKSQGSSDEKTPVPTECKASDASAGSDGYDELFATRDLNSEEAVVNWLKKVVNRIPNAQVLSTVGAQFPHCVPEPTKNQIYRAAVETQRAIRFNKEKLHIPIITGAPGIGKTRMLLESLNILQECAAQQHEDTDDFESNFKKVLTNPKRCTVLYTSFGSGLTNEDEVFWKCADCSGILAIRIIWKYFLYPLRRTKLGRITITKKMAKYLTLDLLIDRLMKIGVKYIVLPIDEMNMLYADGHNKQKFQHFTTSISQLMLEYCNNLFVLFAGTIYSPLKSVIKDLGIPVSISPSMLSLSDMQTILNGLAAKPEYSYLAGWQCAGAFRQCVADMLNPPRAFDYLMMAIHDYIKNNKDKEMNLWTLPYTTFIDNAVFKAKHKMARVPEDAKALIEYCIAKQPVQPERILPSGKTIEHAAQEGYVFAEKPTQALKGMPTSVPFFLLYHWLQNNTRVFGCAAHLFKFSWNDPTAIGPSAWEIFNVKYTSFKLTLLSGEQTKSVPLCTFHSGALFGDECATYSVQLRPTTPVTHLHQFPACFDGKMTSNFMTSMVDGSKHPSSYMETVCLNGKNTTGINAFYWLSEDVIEFQQFQANDNSQNPTILTQHDLDSEYQKAKVLFDKYLAKYNFKFVFGLISNRSPAYLRLKPNMYVVHKRNMEAYYGRSLAAVAQIKSFIAINVNTDDTTKLMKLKGVTANKAAEMIEERQRQPFGGWNDLRQRVPGISTEQDGLVIKF